MDQAQPNAQDTNIETYLGQVLPQRQAEARLLVQISGEVTGVPARIWGKRKSR